MKLAAIAVVCSGCVLDSVDEEHLGTTEQEVNWIGPITWATRTDLVGADTGLPADQHVCVLNSVGGDFAGAGNWTFPSATSSILATAALERGPNGNWFLNAHTGRYGANNWMLYGVKAGGTCMEGQASFNDVWTTGTTHHSNWPRKIAPLAANRRCFLSGIYSGDGMLDSWESYVAVRRITRNEVTPNALPYPETGWYVESNAITSSSDDKFFVRATCIDFASITNDWVGAFGNGTNTMTTGDGVKFCGLQGVYGAYRWGYSTGAFLKAPSTQTGNWTMTVSEYNYAVAECIE